MEESRFFGLWGVRTPPRGAHTGPPHGVILGTPTPIRRRKFSKTSVSRSILGAQATTRGVSAPRGARNRTLAPETSTIADFHPKLGCLAKISPQTGQNRGPRRPKWVKMVKSFFSKMPPKWVPVAESRFFGLWGVFGPPGGAHTGVPTWGHSGYIHPGSTAKITKYPNLQFDLV